MGETRRKFDRDFREGRSSSLPPPTRTSLFPADIPPAAWGRAESRHPCTAGVLPGVRFRLVMARKNPLPAKPLLAGAPLVFRPPRGVFSRPGSCRTP